MAEVWCPLQIIWAVGTLGIGISTLVAYFAPNFAFINDLVKYGKSRSKERSQFQQLIEVPKRWFTHFYIVAVCSMTASLLLAAFKYSYSGSISDSSGDRLNNLLRSLTETQRKRFAKRSMNETAVLLTLSLLWLHAVRRLLESLFTSVYSDTRMNVLHYMVGWMHYILVPITVLAAAPGFITDSSKIPDLTFITATQAIGVALFLWFSYHQHNCLGILADMRRNFRGNITNYAHGIPSGDWFDLVSCPHFFFEIGIYCSLYLTMNMQNPYWVYVLVFVAMNQLLAGLITHKWYKEKFTTMYPSKRKAIIPYVL